MKPGEIVLVNFQGATGIKRRPAVVVSSETYHQYRPDVVLAVITTRIESADAPTDYILVDWHQAGLKNPSAFRSYLGTYERSQLASTIGKLSERDWGEVQERLRIAIAVNQ